MAWDGPKGSSASGRQTPLPSDYGVSAIPQIMLIDSDGTVLARDLRNESIGDAIAKALTPR